MDLTMTCEPERNQDKTIWIKIQTRILNFLDWIARAEQRSPGCPS